jgi:tRNA/tmRNA/rRNA uracil-C5-methylase (TrmA/RlmC/RlmD family)
VLAPLVGDSWGYRRKGRFSVRRVEKKDKTWSASVNRTRASSPTSASA